MSWFYRKKKQAEVTIITWEKTYVVTQKRTINKEKLYIPKYLAEGYDGEVLRFRLKVETRSKFVRIHSTLDSILLIESGTT